MPFNFNQEWEEQGSAPSTPATGNWKLYPKSDGWYYLDDAGTEYGPLFVNGEIFVGAKDIWPSTTTGAAASVITEYTTNDQDLYGMNFDQTTEEYGQFSYWMPFNWDAGTVTFSAVWTAASGSGDVIWGLQGISYANDDPIDATWGTAQTVTDTLIATGDIHYSPTSSAITLAGTPASGALVQFRIYRDADAGGDTLNADAVLLGVKVFFTKA